MKKIGLYLALLGLCMGLLSGCAKKIDEESVASTQEMTEENTTQEESTQETKTPETTAEETTVEETTPEETTASVNFTEVSEVLYCKADQLNVRKSPSIQGEKMGMLTFNQEITRTGVGDNGWSRILFADEIGYVATEYLMTEPYVQPEPPAISLEGVAGTGIFHAGSNGIVVAIDAGHQRHGSSTKEPNGPGSSDMKARVTSGTAGCVSGLAEYQLNLTVSLKLRDALLAQGYSVYMIRETHDVDISNAERATLANQAGANIFLRIHANSSADQSVRGTLTMAPSQGNPYCAQIAGQSQTLSKHIVDQMAAQTGFRNRGVLITDTMTGINWCQMPVSIIEMGFMSNPEEDALMATDEVQNQFVQGIVNGVNAYFGS